MEMLRLDGLFSMLCTDSTSMCGLTSERSATLHILFVRLHTWSETVCNRLFGDSVLSYSSIIWPITWLVSSPSYSMIDYFRYLYIGIGTSCRRFKLLPRVLKFLWACVLLCSCLQKHYRQIFCLKSPSVWHWQRHLPVANCGTVGDSILACPKSCLVTVVMHGYFRATSR